MFVPYDMMKASRYSEIGLRIVKTGGGRKSFRHTCLLSSEADASPDFRVCLDFLTAFETLSSSSAGILSADRVQFPQNKNPTKECLELPASCYFRIPELLLAMTWTTQYPGGRRPGYNSVDTSRWRQARPSRLQRSTTAAVVARICTHLFL